MTVFYTALIICALAQIGFGVEYSVYFEDIVTDVIDPEYIDVDSVDLSVTDENTIDTSFTIVKTFPEDTQAHFAIYGYSMGKYSLMTGIDVTMDLCELVDEPIVMGPFLSVLGFSPEECPPKTGNYHQEGYSLPTDTLPQDFMENKYKVVFELFDKDKIMSVFIFVDVQAQ